MNKNITAIEITTSGIRVVVGYYENKQIILRYACKSDRLKTDADGYIDVDFATRALTSLINDCKSHVEEGLGVFVPIYPADHLEIESDLHAISYTMSDRRLTAENYNNCMGQLGGFVRDQNLRLVFTCPYRFEMEDESHVVTSETSFPIGTPAKNLSMYADCYLIDNSEYQRYQGIIRSANIPRYYFELVTPLAISSLINKMSDNKKAEFSDYVTVDFESDCTHVLSVVDRRLKDYILIPTGYGDCLRRAAADLHIDQKIAEEYMNVFGLEADIPFDDALPDHTSFVSWCKCFGTEMRSLLVQVNDIIAGFHLSRTSSLIVTGTGTKIHLIDSALSDIVNMQTLVFRPNVIGARDMDYLSCLGAIVMSKEGYLENQDSALRHQKDSALRDDKFGRY